MSIYFIFFEPTFLLPM